MIEAGLKELLDELVLCAMAAGDDYAVDSDPAEDGRSLTAARQRVEDYITANCFFCGIGSEPA